MKKNKVTLLEMEDVLFPCQKIGIDTCGPYSESQNGNRYIITMVDQYSGWAQAFLVPNKTADIVCNVIMNELIPRHQCPQTIVSDNGTESIIT